MQNPETLGIEPTSKRAPHQPFRSDSSCWSPLADKKLPAPQCARCGREALGGTFIDLDSGYPMGQVTGTVEFSCGCDGKTVFSIAGGNIAQWQLFRQISPGVFRVRKLTTAERVKALEKTNAGS